MQRPIQTLNLPLYKIKQFLNKGFVYCEDVNVETVKSELGITPEEWKKLTTSVPTKTALDLCEDDSVCSHIVTFSSALDELLGGGVPVKMITEFCGLPGTGKTQMCYNFFVTSLQLCVSTQMPDCFGGLGGHAVYIDTNLGFTPQRLTEIAKGCLTYCQSVADQFNSFEMYEALKTITEDVILNGVYYLQANKFTELLSTLSLFRNLLAKDSQIKLIVIDSITEPAKNSDLEYFERIKIIYTFLSDLQELATSHRFAIVITNDLTTKFDNDGRPYVTPCLGDSFGHRINNRIKLQRKSDILFNAVFLKTVLKEVSDAKFHILEDGIRDIQ